MQEKAVKLAQFSAKLNEVSLVKRFSHFKIYQLKWYKEFFVGKIKKIRSDGLRD